MSKTRKRKTPVPASQEITPSRKRNPWIPIALTVILAAIPFAVGKYGEFKMDDPFDSSGYVYSAQLVLNKAKIGVDHRPSAQMGTLLMNMLGVTLFGFNETGAEVIQTILQVAALSLMGVALYRLYGLGAATGGVFIASFYLLP